MSLKMSQNTDVENEFTFFIWNYEIIIMKSLKINQFDSQPLKGGKQR